MKHSVPIVAVVAIMAIVWGFVNWGTQRPSPQTVAAQEDDDNEETDDEYDERLIAAQRRGEIQGPTFTRAFLKRQEKMRLLAYKDHPPYVSIAKVKCDDADMIIEVALSIIELDICPPERTKRFEWIDQRDGFKVTGCQVELLTIKKNADGKGWLVTMDVYPTVGADGATVTTDHWHEHWTYNDGEMKFVKGVTFRTWKTLQQL